MTAMINGHAESYVRAAISGEVSRLASAQVGDRNRTLFKATAALAGLGLREGQILEHLKPVAESIGLRGKELYSTVKSGVRAGHSKPRGLPGGSHTTPPPVSPSPAPSGQELPKRSLPDAEGWRPTFFLGGNDGPRHSATELRRHVYRRGGKPVRIKIKFQDGRFVNWYRVADADAEGWQAGKPAGYLPCPYVGNLDPFDPELAGDVLYWPEGEKDCDTLAKHALPAFTFGGTGDGLPDGLTEHIRGRQLVILSDNDPAGRDHADRKAALAQGMAASVQIVEFPELAPGGDVSDFLKTRTAEHLQQRVNETRFWTPPLVSVRPAGVTADRELLVCNLADVEPEKVEWLWPGRVALGKLTMIAGEPGLGKSQLSIAVAAAVTTGAFWPDANVRAPVGRVIILSAEDGLADTIRPRFDAAGGDPSRVIVIRAVQTNVAGGSGRNSFNLAADLRLLEAEIERYTDVRLVLIDPVSSYLGKIDSHKNAEVRSVLEPLGEMAERLRVAVLAITHLSKGDGKAINRIIGSIAFVAAARSTFAVVADPDDEAGLRRLLLQVKNNIAPPQPGLAFRLVQQEVAPGVIGSSVAWDSTLPVTTTVDRALNGRTDAGDTTATDEAIEFLKEVLATGAADVLDVEAEARAAAMLSETRRLKESKPFRSAARILGVIKRRVGFGPGARVQWSLPNEVLESNEPPR